MRKDNRLLYLLTLLKIIIPYFLQNSIYEPHRDEFLYLAEGHHLSFGFMDVPPMLSVFAWFTHLLGDGIFWVKLWPSLFGAATFFVCGKIIQSLGGKSFAVFTLFLSFIFGSYLRLFFLFQPNPPEVFFDTMIMFSFIRFIQTSKNRWLYVFGISFGLGMLGKYSVAFLAAAILAALLFTSHRKIFLNKHFWYASLLAFLIFLPTALWEFNHHFPVIHHMQQLKEQQLQYISPASFLIDQYMMNFACSFVWIAGLLFVSFHREAKKFRFIALAFIFFILLLLALHGKNYYALGVYPPLFAFGAYWLEQLTVLRFRFFRYVISILIIIPGILIWPIQLPVFAPAKLASYYQKMNMQNTGALRWEDLQNHPLPQDFSDMLGWEEMTQKVAKAYSMLNDSDKKNVFIFCNNYGMAGAVNFYAPKYNLPEACSDNASFLYWLPSNINIQNMILVSDDPHEKQHDFAKGFKSVTKVDSVTNFYARERGDYIYLFIGADENFKNFFSKKIAEDKAAFKY